jgi:Domain of unknown function (DUF4129)
LRSAAERVIVSSVALVLTWVLLAASLVIGLAALIRMAGPTAESFADITGVIRLPSPVTEIVLTLFVLAAVVFLTDLVRRLRSRPPVDERGALDRDPPRVPPWMRAVTQIVSFMYFVVLAYLLWRQGIPFANMILGSGGGSGIVPALPQQGPVAPPLVTWMFGVLAFAAGLGALGLALWVTFSERLAEWWRAAASELPPTPLTEVVEDSLEDLRTEPDARRAIIRCYARFERVAADSGIARSPWQTPMEFVRGVLDRLPVPRGAGLTLTSLFELARFSDRVLGAMDRDRALAALDEIKAELEEGRADAAAR